MPAFRVAYTPSLPRAGNDFEGQIRAIIATILFDNDLT
jgi:hypothetical protein